MGVLMAKIEVLKQADFTKWQQYNYERLVTGFMGLDEMRGITTDDFVVIAGDTGTGKSTVAFYMACAMAIADNKVLYFNAENSPKVMIDKLTQFGLDNDRHFGKFDANGYNRLKIINCNALGLNDLENAILLEKPKAVFIDLFTILLDGVTMGNLVMATKEVAEKLAEIAVKYKCAIITTQQLRKEDKLMQKPSLQHIQGGSSLQHKATKIITLYRYDVARADELKKKKRANCLFNYDAVKNVIELIVRKDRLGEWSGSVFAKYNYGDGYISLDRQESYEYERVIYA